MDRQYLLITGAPRSGTTLLGAMLGRHPAIAVTNEDRTRSWQAAMGKAVVGVKLCVPNDLECDAHWRTVVRQRMRRWALYGRNNLALPRLKFKIKSVYSLRDFQTWPATRIVGIVRDPHDVIASIHERGGHPEGEARYRWARAVELLHRLLTESPDRVRLVDYDRLVSDPEPTLRGLCAWLEQPFDPAMVSGETPTYALAGVDAGKAGRRGEGRFDHPVFEQVPGLRERYRALVAAAAGPEAVAA